MFDFFKKEDTLELNQLDSLFLDSLNDLEMCSKMVQFELMKHKIEWSHDKVQTFIPLILNYTNFEWLELIAEHELPKEGEKIVKNYLEKVQALIRNGNSRLHGHGGTNGF